MKVVLAEKPSVARDIARVIEAKTRHDGYFEGNGYQVTWSFGHLFSLQEPAAYDSSFKRWSLSTLPIIPDQFQLTLIQNDGVAKQFNTIKKLLRQAKDIICATDAGREGELIFRYIYQMAGCEGRPFQRLWLSSLTEEAIRSAFQNLRSGRQYDPLFAAARCRHQSDWIVGLNGTRNFTVRYGGSERILWSVGRVQTPVLAIIVNRDDQIRNFQPEPFWELMTTYRKVTFKYKGNRFSKEEKAQKLKGQAEGHSFKVLKVNGKRQSLNPPLLYDLTSLQRDMNQRYGFSAAQTLELAQSLYENKLLTYPRTDSQYLSNDMKSDVVEALRKLKPLKEKEISALDLNKLGFNARIVNNKKVTDHHAIIPTGRLPKGISPQATKVFEAVLIRTIAVFYPKCIKEITTVEGEANRVKFQAKGTRIVSPGWTVLYPQPQSKKEEDQPLPEFVPDETGPHTPFVRAGKTTPPRHYTENSLLAAMETAGRMVEDEQLREALKERGIGTPATRGEIIETLLKRGYIVRDQKRVTATNLGRYLIALIKNPNLKSPDLTGEWEGKLKAIERGEYDAGQFMREVTNFTQQLIENSNLRDIGPESSNHCPRCGGAVVRGKKGYGCANWRDGCQFVLWETYKEIRLSERQIQVLLQHGVLLKPWVDRQQNEFILYLSTDGYLMELPVPKKESQGYGNYKGKKKRRSSSSPRQKKGNSQGTTPSKTVDNLVSTCPHCQQSVLAYDEVYRCRQCKLKVPRVIAGKKINQRSVKTLLEKGETSVLKGFESKEGRPFDARLKLTESGIRLIRQ